jgi:hypothetical protein
MTRVRYPAAMSSFLTVSDAAKLVGKSPSAIRRLIHPIVRDETHPDRDRVQPSPQEVRELRLKGKQFPWLIDEEFLRSKVRSEPKSETMETQSPSPQGASTNHALIEMLRHELETKNRQIAKQDELLNKQMHLIEGLGERIHESNVLIGSLQQQLALPDRTARHGAATEAASEKKAEPTTKSRAKRRWLGLF